MGEISQKHFARQCRDILKACEAEGKELSTTQKYMFEVGSNSHLYSADGTAPLIAFLSSVAIEAWLRVADDDEELDDEAIDNEFMVLLSKAKQDIVTGKLVVQRARSQVRVNDDPDIISGISASDNATLFDANLVVRKDDAIAWLKDTGTIIPACLASLHSGVPDDALENIHTTQKLEILNKAREHFWDGYDPSSSEAPTNNDVAEWIVNNYKIAPRLAGYMATILRPDELRPGPRIKPK